MHRYSFTILFFALAVRGVPVPAPSPESVMPSLLGIKDEDELGIYSKKWNLTPVQMCTLMGHQMTVAQPLLDINHPLVSHLPSIGEMAMSDAVMICEKVLNDHKGRIATVTTVVEETREEYSVPRDFLFDDDFLDLKEDIMDELEVTDEELMEALEDNEEALIDLLQEQFGGSPDIKLVMLPSDFGMPQSYYGNPAEELPFLYGQPLPSQRYDLPLYLTEVEYLPEATQPPFPQQYIELPYIIGVLADLEQPSVPQQYGEDVDIKVVIPGKEEETPKAPPTPPPPPPTPTRTPTMAETLGRLHT